MGLGNQLGRKGMHVLINGQFAGQQMTGSGQYLKHLLSCMKRLAPDCHFELALPPERSHRPLVKLWWEQAGWPYRTFVANPDICHVPYFSSPLFGRVDVVTVHDLIGMALPEYSADPRWRTYLALAGRAVRRARRVIVDSQVTADDVENYLDFPSERIRVVHLGVESGREISRAELDLHMADIGVRRPYCLYLGSGDMRKNIGLLLEALAATPPQSRLQLVIAGAVRNLGTPLVPDYRRRAQELGIAAWVTFTGPVSHDRKLALYAGARMFLFPSIYEGFGLELLEAMAYAVPVIAADSTCTPEVTGGAALLLPPDRPTQWAEAMAVLDRDDAARKQLIGAGRERAAHLTWERTAAATLAVYRELA